MLPKLDSIGVICYCQVGKTANVGMQLVLNKSLRWMVLCFTCTCVAGWDCFSFNSFLTLLIKLFHKIKENTKLCLFILYSCDTLMTVSQLLCCFPLAGLSIQIQTAADIKLNELFLFRESHQTAGWNAISSLLKRERRGEERKGK